MRDPAMKDYSSAKRCLRPPWMRQQRHGRAWQNCVKAPFLRLNKIAFFRQLKA
jgi:hypothetical protein